MSPEVWADARRLILDGNAQLAQPVPIAWPNERFEDPEPPVPFIFVEGRGDTSEPYELGGGVWVEDGAVLLHIAVPTGSGIERGIAIRKAASGWFRGLPPRPVVYEGFSLDPGAMDEDGNWYRLTLRVRYRYQDIGIA